MCFITRTGTLSITQNFEVLTNAVSQIKEQLYSCVRKAKGFPIDADPFCKAYLSESVKGELRRRGKRDSE